MSIRFDIEKPYNEVVSQCHAKPDWALPEPCRGRGRLPEVRSRIVIHLVKELGIPLAEIGRQLGITTSSVSKIVNRKGRD